MDEMTISKESTGSPILQMAGMGLCTAGVAFVLYLVIIRRTAVKKQKRDPLLDQQTIITNAKEGIRISAIERHVSEEEKRFTVYDMFLRGLSLSKDKPFFGSRRTHKEAYKWITYNQVNEQMIAIGSAITELLGSSEKDKLIGIVGKNSPEWFITELGCVAYSHVVVPLYDTLGEEACQHILNQTQTEIVFGETSANLEQLFKLGSKYIKYAIVFRPDDKFHAFKKQHCENIQIYSFEEFKSFGQRHRHPLKLPNSNSLLMICYTSGSTGLPKGVMLTHEGAVQTVLKVMQALGPKINDQPAHVHLSYLPLAHVMEQLIMICVISRGARVGFITSDISGILNDAKQLKPTILMAVPRILTRIRDDYLKSLRRNLIAIKLFDYALKIRAEEQRIGVYKRNTIWDWLFFRSIRDPWGGAIEILVCGSAPLPQETHKFAQAGFACQVFEGYGSTEVSGALTFTVEGEYCPGHVGAVIPGFEVKLADVPEMNLVYARDGQGEICARGLSCTKGYYLDDVKTAELYDEDGWLHMGDVGRWTPEGALEIVDRCKNIFKLSQGEYVAPAKVEDVYQTSALVTQIFVDGNSLQSFVVAVVVPSFQELHTALKKLTGENAKSTNQNNEIDKMTPEQLCANPLSTKLVMDDLKRIGRQSGLKGFEMVKAIYLCPEHFTIENQLLTPTLKASRPHLRRHFAKIIEQLYATPQQLSA